MIAPDPRNASKFLSWLDQNDEFTFQTFQEGAGADRTRPTVLHGSFDVCAPTLLRLNDDGAGIFVMVNAGDGVVRPGSKTCRTAANVMRVRALFVDLDGAPIGPPLVSALPPDWVVQSSPGRWHAYWLVDECPPEEFAGAQGALAQRFMGDPSVKDLPRVMRLPGFVHRKGAPYLSELYMPTDYPQILENQK